MKRIINGKRYDTETSILIGVSVSPLPQSSHSWWTAALHKTPRSGDYFLVGQGGPMTVWHRNAGGDGKLTGWGILPMNEAAAERWASHELTKRAFKVWFRNSVSTL